MAPLREYLLTIVAASMLCSIACALCGKSSLSSSMRMLTGLIMTVCIIKPVLPLQLEAQNFDISEITARGGDIVSQGNADAQAFASAIISDRISAYIEEKAAKLGADIEADTVLAEGIPAEINISGSALPYIRTQMIAWIEKEIGIKREAVYWR